VCWVYGQDWSVTAGQEEGISQVYSAVQYGTVVQCSTVL
jgi:hypothetical protein